MSNRRWRWTAAWTVTFLALSVPASVAQSPATAERRLGGFGADALVGPEELACRSDARSTLDDVADLLIEGRAAEAKAAAEVLVAARGLTARDRARARQLLTKAEERLARAAPDAAPPSPFPAASFAVLQAQVGGGFSAGTAGSLRFAESGVSFLPRGSSQAAWTVPWERLPELVADDGLWDARHPLALRQHDGPPAYLALIDDEGDDLPPDRLLAAFERARREAARRRAADAAGGAGGSPGKERKR